MAAAASLMFWWRPQGPAHLVVYVPSTSRNMHSSSSSVDTVGNSTSASARNSVPAGAAASWACTAATSKARPTRDSVGFPVSLSQTASTFSPAIWSCIACTSTVWAFFSS